MNGNPIPNDVGALVSTYTILGVPYYSYGIIYPKTLFSLIIKALFRTWAQIEVLEHMVP